MTDDTTLEVRRHGHSVTVRLARPLVSKEERREIMDLIFEILERAAQPEFSISTTPNSTVAPPGNTWTV